MGVILMSAMIDEIECYECGTTLPTMEAVADPNGNPLCKNCFNKLVLLNSRIDKEDLR